jgi:hypothetical protein
MEQPQSPILLLSSKILDVWGIASVDGIERLLQTLAYNLLPTNCPGSSYPPTGYAAATDKSDWVLDEKLCFKMGYGVSGTCSREHEEGDLRVVVGSGHRRD